jgi:hypothetical protein
MARGQPKNNLQKTDSKAHETKGIFAEKAVQKQPFRITIPHFNRIFDIT